MSAAHKLHTLQREITDIRMLVQHRLRAAQAASAEALLRGSGPHGQRFAAEHLEPQVRLLHAASDALLALSQAMEAAARQAQAAEAHLVQARLAADAVQPAHAEARRLTVRARELAVLARERVCRVEDSCRSIGNALNGLGSPPA